MTRYDTDASMLREAIRLIHEARASKQAAVACLRGLSERGNEVEGAEVILQAAVMHYALPLLEFKLRLAEQAAEKEESDAL